MPKAVFEGYVREISGPSLGSDGYGMTLAVERVIDTTPSEIAAGLNWKGEPPRMTFGRVRITIEPVKEPAGSSIPGLGHDDEFPDSGQPARVK